MQLTQHPKSRQNDLVIQELKDEVLIYDLKINKAYCLNPTSAMIWNLCDGNNTVADITLNLRMKLQQPVTDDLVWLALEMLIKDNLLAENEDLKIGFSRVSRREAVRKIGFASLVVLPAVASLVAPTTAMAQSQAPSARCSNGGFEGSQGTCSSSSQRCVSNVCLACSPSGTPLGGPCGSGRLMPELARCCSRSCRPGTFSCL